MTYSDYGLPYLLAFLCFLAGAATYFFFFRRAELAPR